MLKIRLQKTGKKNAASYRVVLTEHTSPPQGKFIEILGSYNPRLKQKVFKQERIQHWISKGAQASPTVHNLLIDEKIIQGEKVKAWKPKKKKGEEKKETPKLEGETPVEESKPETEEKPGALIEKGPVEPETKPKEIKKEESIKPAEQPEKPAQEPEIASEEPSEQKPEVSAKEVKSEEIIDK